MATLRRHIADPLFRNAYALMINTATTGLLGVAYWLLAARRYAPADVGRASAAYSAMSLLAGFTALNLTGALTRFIPQSGRRTAGLIGRAYAISSVASVVIAIPFLLTVTHWGSSYRELGSVTAGLLFTGSVVTWAIFTLQDGVLTGLRNAIWVPIENGLFGIIKIVLLAALAVTLPHTGIYVSWMLPVAVSLPLINTLIFVRLVPRHAVATAHRSPPTRRQIGRFLAGDYAGALCVLATTTLVPVTVAVRIGPSMNAYFYVAWVIGGTLDLFAVNMATSLTVEGAFDAATLAVNCRAALYRALMILVPVAAGMALLAPWALGLFGPGYAAHGARILELLAAATLPKTVTELYIGVLRAQSRTSVIALIQAVRCVLVLGLALALTTRMGVVGAGVAVLASQAVVAAAVAPRLRRILARPQRTFRLTSRGDISMEVAQGDQPIANAGPPGVGTVAPAARPRGSRWRWLPVAVPGLLTVAGLALFVVPLRGLDLHGMNGLGLISVMPATCLAGIGLLAFAFVITLGQSRARPAMLAVTLATIVICLDAVTVLIEPEPRFATAYQIAGFTEYISRTGHVAPGIAAYFSWPGFFALVAFVEAAAGTHNIIPVLRLWPVGIDLLCVVALFLVMRNLRLSWRAKWAAAFLFAVGNWVGQDYFSPQSFNYLLYLLFVAILLTWFGRPAPAPPPADPRTPPPTERRWRAVFEPGERLSPQIGGLQRTVLLAVLIAIFVFSTASHQLTPFFMLCACGGLVLARRCTLTGLPVLLGVILAGWISFAAVDFWSGHLSTLFGGIGHLRGNLSTNVTGRMVGSTPVHIHALQVRTGLAAAIMIMATCGLLRRRHLAVDDRSAWVLMCVPFLLVGLQNYGGEIGLRVYLFALPGACILAGCVFFPATRAPRRAWRALPALAVCAIVLSGAFFIARYGNEAFEQIPRGELTATNYVYAHDKAGARLVWLSPAPAVDNTPQMPWQYRDFEKVDYIPAQAPRNPASVGGLVARLRDLGPGTYLMTTRTQETYLEQAASYSPGWGTAFNVNMAAAHGVRVAFADADAVVYTLRWPPGTPAKPLSIGPARTALRATVWTPVGLIVFGIALFALMVREFARVGLRAAPRFLRLLTLASVPAVVLLIAVVVERFIVLS